MVELNINRPKKAQHWEKPISIAILAMGGQGGGVLTNWIVAVAEAQGWSAQSTSVPGVAQRTGATLYYIEMLKPYSGKKPVFSLTPTPGDVDIVISAEYMEAGRAILRGLVTPDKTTLIASTHRSFAISEKAAPGDSIANSDTVHLASEFAAKREIIFDMNDVALSQGSIISSALFGALAGSQALPFPRSAYERAIQVDGKGVSASLKSFSVAFERTQTDSIDKKPTQNKPKFSAIPNDVDDRKLQPLLTRLKTEFPKQVQNMLYAGLSRVVDFQDPKYGEKYLNDMAELCQLDRSSGGEQKDFKFSNQAAKYLAVAMAYDDIIRVADLKTKKTRFNRINEEIGVQNDQLIYLTEYMHPRMKEISDVLPYRFANWLDRRKGFNSWLERRINKGRRVKTNTVFWFVTLYIVASLRRLRPSSKRHKYEMDHIEQWLQLAMNNLPTDYDFAVEIINSRRLVKGYSDTHDRTRSKFNKIIGTIPQLTSRLDAADWLRRLQSSAMADENADKMNDIIKSINAL